MVIGQRGGGEEFLACHNPLVAYPQHHDAVGRNGGLEAGVTCCLYVLVGPKIAHFEIVFDS